MIRSFFRQPNNTLILNLVAGLVLISGLLTLAFVVFGHQRFHFGSPVVDADATITALAGLSFVYLANLLRRGKHSAWLVSVGIYVLLVGRNIRHFFIDLPANAHILPAALNLIIPCLALCLLLAYRRYFTVLSETRRIALSLRWAAMVVAVAFLFGVSSLLLVDERDFHQEISLPQAAHYTVDQFNLTTQKPLTAYTRRGRAVQDSLSAVSIGALVFVGISFFAPIRFRLSSHESERQRIEELLQKYSTNSEDFFKLWPRDKAYFLSPSELSAIAYRAVGSVALVVGDPIGKSSEFSKLIVNFKGYCKVNDWQPAFIHTSKRRLNIYRELGFDVQKIGEEAIVDIQHFEASLRTNKYFRQINNRFSKMGYSYETLLPPHSPSVIDRLRRVSNDWLEGPSRSERGFMMGYFNSDYLQQCKILVARDDAKTIQAFINQIPSFDPSEANFDLLRHSATSPGNINDYLLMGFIDHLSKHNFKTLNMGLAPLSGLGSNEERTVINGVLGFVYSNGGRFYSFKGLERFKSKYEPSWQNRYIVYAGGIRGFSKTLNALMRAMRVKKSSLRS